METFFPGTERFPMLAKTVMGLENELAGELLRLGAADIKVLSRGVAFSGDLRLLYSANYNLRTALRVLRHLAIFPVEKELDVYTNVMEVPWHTIMDGTKTFVVDAITFSPLFRNSMYLAQRVKDGVADRFRKETGRRPNIDKDNPDIRIHILVTDKRAILSLDSSGESLHKRGYRIRQGQASLNEVLAAGLILKSGWHGESHFIDPMCGSGTLPIEAAMYALGVPPGFMRKKYALLNWKEFDASLYQAVRTFTEIEKPPPVKISGSDRSAVAIRLARMNLANAGLEHLVKLSIMDIHDVHPPVPPGVVMFDPPFGKRMKSQDLSLLYRNFMQDLKRKFGGYQAWIITGVPGLLKTPDMKPAGSYPMNHGGLSVRFVKYDIPAKGERDNAETEHKRIKRPRTNRRPG